MHGFCYHDCKSDSYIRFRKRSSLIPWGAQRQLSRRSTVGNRLACFCLVSASSPLFREEVACATRCKVDLVLLLPGGENRVTTMGDKHLSVCQMCKEPVWNFICVDCIAEGIRDFLPSVFRSSFDSFQHTLSIYFHGDESAGNACLSCHKHCSFALCHYCYTSEVYQWLEETNQPLAKRFMNVFSFGFYSPSLASASQEPVAWEQRKEDAGICDECGNYSDELFLLSGEWACRDCGRVR